MKWTEQDIKNLQRNPRKKRRQKAPPRQKQNANALAKAIVKYLNFSGDCTAWRQNNAGIWDRKANAYRRGSVGMKGLSDVIGIAKNGKWIAVEIKVNGDILSETQIRFLDLVGTSGGVAIVARSFDQFEQEYEKQKSKLL